MNPLFRSLLLVVPVALALEGCENFSKNSSKEPFTGYYTGSPVPGEIPELFAPGFIRTGQ